MHVAGALDYFQRTTAFTTGVRAENSAGIPVTVGAGAGMTPTRVPPRVEVPQRACACATGRTAKGPSAARALPELHDRGETQAPLGPDWGAGMLDVAAVA